MLVVDASVGLAYCMSTGEIASLDEQLIAPPLMWSEGRSVLHEMAWRGETSAADAEGALARLEHSSVAPDSPAELAAEAWRIADELGWAKTYDAEYVALARLRGCRLVTLDERLRRGTERLCFVVGPTEV